MKRTNPYLLTVGKKVQFIRKSKKITVRKLGEMCDTDYSNLSRFENGQINTNLLLLKRIADELGVKMKDFL
jgi:transcriptional regulator with XRE-family HTH domain